MKSFFRLHSTKPRRKPLFICFTGMDGSGKTTQALGLANWLRGQGIECRYVWNRIQPRFLSPFIRLGKTLFLRGQDIGQNYHEYYSGKKRVLRSVGLALVFPPAFAGEYLLQTTFQITIPFWRGKNVVSDRYFYDLLVDMAVDLGYSWEKVLRMKRRLSRLLPRPNVTVLLDLPETIAFARKDDIPALDYLRERRQIYLKLSQEEGMLLMDGATAAEQLGREIRERLVPLLSSFRDRGG